MTMPASSRTMTHNRIWTGLLWRNLTTFSRVLKPQHRNNLILENGTRVFSVIIPRLWNSLPPVTRNSSSEISFLYGQGRSHYWNVSFPSPWLSINIVFLDVFLHCISYRMSTSLHNRHSSSLWLALFENTLNANTNNVSHVSSALNLIGHASNLTSQK